MPLENRPHVPRPRGRPPGRPNQPRIIVVDQRAPPSMPPSFDNPSGIRAVLCNPSGPPMKIKTCRRPYRFRNKQNKVAKVSDCERFHDATVFNAHTSSIQRVNFQTFARSSDAASAPFARGATTMIGASHAQQPIIFRRNEAWPPVQIDNLSNLFSNFNPGGVDNQVETTPTNTTYDYDFGDELLNCHSNARFDSSTPPPLPHSAVQFQPLFDNSLMQAPPSMIPMPPSLADLYADFLPPHLSATSQENQVTSSVSTPPDPQSTLPSQLPTVPSSSSCYSQLPGFNSLTQVRLPSGVQSRC